MLKLLASCLRSYSRFRASKFIQTVSTIQFCPQARFKLMGCCFQKKRTSTKQSVNRRTRTTNSIRLARGGILGLCWLFIGAQRLVFVVSGHLETSRRAPGLGSSAQILGGWQVMACDSGMQGRFVPGLYSAHALFPGFFAST